MGRRSLDKPKVRTSTSFIAKTPLRTIPDQQKIRELPPKMNVQEVEDPKGRKSTSCIMKTPLRTIRDQRKARELPRKMNIEEVEGPKKYENYHAKPVSDPFKSITEHRKARELPRKMNIEAGNYENYIPRKSRARPPRPPEKYENYHEKCTCKHESTKIATNSVRHLDLAPRPFTPTVRTPSVKHAVWGTDIVSSFHCTLFHRLR